jgi:hypothetical protein
MRVVAGPLLLLTFVLGACTPGVADDAGHTPEASSVQAGAFDVRAVRVDVSDTTPQEVTLEVEGAFPDACTQVGEVLQDRAGLSVTVTIRTVRQDGSSCGEAAVPHQETIRLGPFEQEGTYALQVNSISSEFIIGEAAQNGVDPYDAPVSAPHQTPDGALSLLGPVDWPVESGPGFLRLAATEGALYDTGTPSAARVTFTVATGPFRAMDFHLDGHTVREVYAYFALYPESNVAAPTDVVGLAWPGVEGHSRGSQTGDRHLIVLGIDDQTILAIQAYCPQGDWGRFEPMLRAIVESLELP